MTRFINKEHMSMNIKHLTSVGLAVVIAGVAVIVFAVGGGAARTRPSRSVTAASAVSVRSTSLGKTLVDAKGRTLYLFEGDSRNVSRLSSAGLAVWPRLAAAGRVTAGSGLPMSKVGTTTSPRGVRQVTYNGHPLYYYVGDSKPGSTRGQALNEFGALWYVLSPSGNAVSHAPGAAQVAPPATTPAYGY
jgi:predicted lipoprotein with Yx(FWY)xxD motif